MSGVFGVTAPHDELGGKALAPGQNVLGEKIIETARRHGVPIGEDPVLVHALSTIEMDGEIPETLYRAVAEVLGFLLDR